MTDTTSHHQSPGLKAAAFAILITASGYLGSAAPEQTDERTGNYSKVRLTVPSIQTSGGEKIILDGADDRRQLVVEAMDRDGDLVDISREIRFSVTPKGIVEVDATGRLSPVSDGSADVEVIDTTGTVLASKHILVTNAGQSQPVHFVNDVIPVLTKLGCNGGGCHGKSGGQNGFRLSLLGFEPTEDYEWLVKESRSRRIIPAAPEYSLLLTKATGEVPHGGGSRLDKGSEDYDLLVRWIRQGMDFGSRDAAFIESIDVYPSSRMMRPGGGQQLVVTARMSDGSTKDVTRSALFESNVTDMATPDPLGYVSVSQQPGDVAVMVRFQGKVDVFRAMIPLGAPATNYPEPSGFVDELVFRKLALMGVPASPVADDGTFLRRVTLDIAGRLPTPDELEAFESSNSPDKKAAVIDRLLDSEDYAEHFAAKWSALLRNKRTRDQDKRGNFIFHRWIKNSLNSNKPFDQFASEILTAQGDMQFNPATGWYRQVNETTEMLEDSAQLFLGTRIQCAQCHHHPFERWSQKDYYQFSAFFSRVGRRNGSIPGEPFIFHQSGSASAVNRKNGGKVSPAPLGGEVIDIQPDEDPRVHLANWMRNPDNPFFARTLINRYWKHFFGTGLVEPEDDIRATNPPTNPELFEALAVHFIQSGYDLKQLIRTICNSTVYQLDSMPDEWNASDRQHFSRFYPKRLQAEVLMDSIGIITGSPYLFTGLPSDYRAVALPDNSFNKDSYFLTVFGRPESESACECERTGDASLAQSLHLINSPELQEKLASNEATAAGLAADTDIPDEDHIRYLYRLALSRNPASHESRTALDYINLKIQNSPDKDTQLQKRREAYEDIIWALINTKEFLFNH